MRMQKLLCAKTIIADTTTTEIFLNVQKNYSFEKPGNLKKPVVYPFMIIIDGQDVMLFENEPGVIEMGAMFPAIKPEDFFLKFKNSKNFNDTLNEQIKEQFLLIFKSIKKLENKKLIEFKKEDVQILPTNRAFYSLDKRQVIIPYFIVLPNNNVIKFELYDIMKDRIMPINFKEFLSTGMVNYKDKINYITKVIAYLISINDIVQPIFDFSKTFPNY